MLQHRDVRLGDFTERGGGRQPIVIDGRTS
jgi:hypothetical protein